MDADRFDDFVRALGLSAARRGMIAGLFSGGLATLLASLESDARRANRHQGSNDELSTEKRKKRKKKRKKRKKKGSPGDEAPPCTEESCPLPPGCSEQRLEECHTAFQEALLADAEPCRALCEGGNSPTCRACLEPHLLAHLSGAEGCVVESCSSTARTAAVGSGRVASRAWVERKCDKPCCSSDLNECQEDARDEWLAEMIAVVITCFGPPPAGLLICLPAMLGVQARLLYNDQKCQYRYGCQEDGPYWGSCGPDGSCCPRGQDNCGGGECCGPNAHCCEGGGCCHDGDTCCRRESGLVCCPPGAQCMQTGIPCCSNC